MKDNSMIEQLKNEITYIETSKNKYFLLGFILGITPFVLLLIIFNMFNAPNTYNIFTQTILIAALFTATINAFILKHKSYNRLIEFFNLKYNVDYNKIKKSF